MKIIVPIYGWVSVGDPIFGYRPQLIIVATKSVIEEPFIIDCMSRELTHQLFVVDDKKRHNDSRVIDIHTRKEIYVHRGYNRKMLPSGHKSRNPRHNIPTKRVHPNYLASQQGKTP